MKYPQPGISLGRVLVTLLLLWGAVAIADRLWFLADRSVPAWDQADYLNGSLTYLRSLQNPQWASGDWWRQFWQLRSKIPPLTYISAALVQMVVGKGPDAAVLVLSIFSLVLLVSTYAIGALVCTSQIGLWAAGLIVLLPGLYRFRLEFLLDYPLAAMVTASFAALTLWRSTDPVLKATRERQVRLSKSRPYQPVQSDYSGSSLSSQSSLAAKSPLPQPTKRSVMAWVMEWLSAIAFGFSLGLAFLTKQPALFFLAVPIAWMTGVALVKQHWGRLAQLVAAFGVSLVVWGPWYRANWLLMLTAGKRATIDAAAIEGDPPLNTLAAWTFYFTHLPRFVSWPLLAVPIAGLLAYAVGRFVTGRSVERVLTDTRIGWREARWLGLFFIGGYLLSSLNVNKDARYILPLVPVLAVVLAAGLVALGQKGWGRNVRWATAIAGGFLAIFNLVPLGINPGIGLGWSYQPYTGQEWPHQQVVDKTVEAAPYQQSTVGVLPSTPSINQHNINYYGALRDWRVYGRQVGTRAADLEQDARSLDWFLTKTGNPGSVPDTQADIKRIVEEGGEFELEDSWTLPNDEGVLKLYRQSEPPVVVERDSDVSVDLVRLASVTVPESVLPDQPVPVTYEWMGPGAELQNGVVLLTWESERADAESEGELTPEASDSGTNVDEQEDAEEVISRWIHDRGIGDGCLRTSAEPEEGYRVMDRTAMLPPENIDPGTYSLSATYLSRTSGDTYEIELPDSVQLEIADDASPVEAPELDLVTQLRNLAPQLRAGDFDPVFAEIGRINQYDPTQDYLEQAAISLDARLKDDPDNLDYLYALAIARVQQQDSQAALAALETAAELDTDNPYAQGFVAFVHLYDWHPNLAQPWIDKAIVLDPDIEEIQILDGVAALMRGNIVKAWRMANTYL
ncbi:MAG: phospholipid carrier-dependent glycosyltransferase [Cyanobacteria bacterium P01_G01_bin.4]